jgi:hypothetical protein
MTTTGLAWHAVAADGLGRLAATAGPAGVVLGRQHSGELAPVRLFRPEPTRVGLIGGSWLEWLVVFRCLGAGARVEITTATPSRWSGVGGLAGVPDRVTIRSANEAGGGPGPATSAQPVLRVNDVGLSAATEPVELGPWEALLTVVPTLTATAAPLLVEAHVLLLQRLSVDEAAVCASTLHLPPASETNLRQRHDDLLVVVIAGAVRYLWYAMTSIEEELLGRPRRGDRR